MVNVTLAAVAKHRQLAALGMHVYHVASSTVNPLVFRDVFQSVFHHFSRSPVVDAAGQPIPVQPMRFCDSMEQYASNTETNATLTRWARRPASAERLRKAVIAQIMHLGRIYEPYTFSTEPGSTPPTQRRFSQRCRRRRGRGSTLTCVAWTGRIT